MIADLHIHSTLSDGSDTREQILQKASALGIKVMSFTEHDSVAGYEDGIALAASYGIKALPGVEISAYDFASGKKAHILGFNYSGGEHITALCEPLLMRRHGNSLRKIEILRELGYKITEDDVRRYAGKYIYKQHILKYLVDSGQEDELFGKVYYTLFKQNGPCDFDITYVDAVEAVQVINADGGKAVLAHPGQQDNFSMIPQLKEAGLWGIELLHPMHNQADREKVLAEAEKFGLYCTGGSDYHGTYTKTIHELGHYSPAEATVRLLTE